MSMRVLSVEVLLSIPDHLRKTLMSLVKFGRADADEISHDTNRARAVESAYLNQLHLMGYVAKQRVGRKAIFTCFNMDCRVKSLIGKISKLPRSMQAVFSDDIITAAENRIAILERN